MNLIENNSVNADASRVQIVANQDNNVKDINTSVANSTPAVSTEIRDEFVRAKKSNGLVRKLYDFLKNKTGVGLGSKRLEQEVDKYEQGQITQSEAEAKIKKYKASQENILQASGDIIAGAASMGAFYTLSNRMKRIRAQLDIGALPKILSSIFDELGKNSKKVEAVKNLIKSNTKTTLIILPAVALFGGMTKFMFNVVERISSKEYTSDRALDYTERKRQKKDLRNAKLKSNFKSFFTGMVAGLMAPVAAIAGGIAGVPLYVAGMTGMKYLENKHEDKKSFGGFVDSIKDNAVANTVMAAALSAPAIKHARYTKNLETAIEKVTKKLKGKELKYSEFSQPRTVYNELEDAMLNSEPIRNILRGGHSIPETITKLTQENIFAVKFLQIQSSLSPLSKALQNDCPVTRDLQQAQKEVNRLMGNSDYTLSKLLGVGTIAETYLAKDKTGKEVCVKILKEGINAKKIARDKEKFVQLIKNGVPDNKLSEETKYLLRNIDDLADGISKEVDFVNEMNAAKELVKYTKKADVVKPILAKDGIYIMEKAPGISVKTLMDYFSCKMEMLFANGNKKAIEELQKKMAKIKAKSPDFADFEITEPQIRQLLKSYFEVCTEQFTKLNSGEKVIHADIHPGNMFINLEALKTGKGKLFTLIDTGNTIKLTKEQSIASLKIIAYMKNGNTKDLTRISLQDAVLPKGMTKEEAARKVEADMRKVFFDGETKINSMTLDTFAALSDNILRKHGIISGNTQFNLNKAQVSADKSGNDLLLSFIAIWGDKLKDIDRGSKTQKRGAAMDFGTSVLGIGRDRKLAKSIQETKNLFHLSLKELWNFFRNPNMNKTNSEEYLTYIFKQNMNSDVLF